MVMPKIGWRRQFPLMTIKLIKAVAMEEAAEVLASAIAIEDEARQGAETDEGD